CDDEPERVVDTLGGIFGDVLVEGPRRRASREDAFHRRRVHGAESHSVREGGVDVGAVVAGTQEQDLPGVVRPDARWVGGGELRQERGGALAHLLEGGAQLVDVDGGPALGARMRASQSASCAEKSSRSRKERPLRNDRSCSQKLRSTRGFALGLPRTAAGRMPYCAAKSRYRGL